MPDQFANINCGGQYTFHRHTRYSDNICLNLICYDYRLRHVSKSHNTAYLYTGQCVLSFTISYVFSYTNLTEQAANYNLVCDTNCYINMDLAYAYTANRCAIWGEISSQLVHSN